MGNRLSVCFINHGPSGSGAMGHASVEAALRLALDGSAEIRWGTADLRWHRLRPGDAALRELFRRADVLCLPTFRDAVPWVVIEAFASGTPVIGSDAGALPEFIGAGSERGMVVTKGDVPALGLRSSMSRCRPASWPGCCARWLSKVRRLPAPVQGRQAAVWPC